MELSFGLPQQVKPSEEVSLEMPEQQCGLLHDVNCIRSLIMTAKAQEIKNRTLEHLLSKSLLNLHPAIEVPECNPIESLSRFVSAYIENVPNFFEAMINAAFESGLEKALARPLKVAIDFFLTPSTRVFDHYGLDELVGQSFFAHRLFEEINDNYQIKTGIAIVYVEMITANVIVHAILGEEYANNLEQALQNTTQHILEDDSLFETTIFQRHLSAKEELWDSAWQHWSSVFAINSIKLNFNNNANRSHV